MSARDRGDAGIRIVIPPFGFGMKYAEMWSWLDEHVGKRNYYRSGGRGFGEPGKPYVETTTYHFIDLKTAQAFADRFGDVVELAVGPESSRPD